MEHALDLLSSGIIPSAILDDHPEPEDIGICTAYVHAVIAGDRILAQRPKRRSSVWMGRKSRRVVPGSAMKPKCL